MPIAYIITYNIIAIDPFITMSAGLRRHRPEDDVPVILLQTKAEYHRWVISHKQYLILRGELGKTLSMTYLLMRLLALGLPARRTIKILGTAWCSRHDTIRKYRFSWLE